MFLIVRMKLSRLLKGFSHVWIILIQRLFFLLLK